MKELNLFFGNPSIKSINIHKFGLYFFKQSGTLVSFDSNYPENTMFQQFRSFEMNCNLARFCGGQCQCNEDSSFSQLYFTVNNNRTSQSCIFNVQSRPSGVICQRVCCYICKKRHEIN